MTTKTAISYDVEVDKIESEYSGSVKVSCTEADYQKRRDMNDAEIDWKDDRPESKLARIRSLRAEPKRFQMTLTKEEARGYGIGSRIRVTVEAID